MKFSLQPIFKMAEAEGANDVKIHHSSSGSKAILRIKRKRSADPADILLLVVKGHKLYVVENKNLKNMHVTMLNNIVDAIVGEVHNFIRHQQVIFCDCVLQYLCKTVVSHAFKKAFTDEDHKLSTDASNAVQRVFRLAGTVSKKNEETLSQEILTKLSSSDRHKSKVKVNPRNELTVDSINEKLRETKKLKRQTSRYKVISNNRHELEDDATQEIDEVDAGTQEMMRLYQLYDVVLDEAEARNIAEEKEQEKEEINPDAILCNSVKMIREKLKIDEGPKSTLDILEKDYVYDVYCADDNYGALSEVLDIIHLNESQLITEASDDELDLYEDDDDSNDENNWRNDYPDEDEWNGSSDDEPRYRNEYFEYGYDGRNVFSRALSSDEELDCYGKNDDEYAYEIVDEEYN